MRSISEPFIRRPVATTLLMVGLTLAGTVGYLQLPIAALPQVEYPTIVVSTLLPGASASTMASAVTAPLERQFGQMPSLSQMTSVSSEGSSHVTLQFELDRDIDGAQQDVQAAINAASNLLPRTLPAPPTYSKTNPADAPVLTLSVSAETLPLQAVADYTDSILAQKISQVSGVGLVTIGGGQKPAVRVQVDPEALAGTGLTLEDVRVALVSANVNQPKGTIEGERQSFTLDADDQLTAAAAYEPVVLAFKNGAPVRLREIADVVDGVENAQLAGWAGKERAVIVNVQRQPGANVIAVAERVKALLPRLQASLPAGMAVTVLSDRTETVRASVKDVELTLALTIALVIAVMYLFLHDLRATAIPAVTVPLSLVGTFGVMSLLGYSLDNLSLMALTICTGFVVDDAIVMIENISRYLEKGKSPFEAALIGAGEIGFTIVSLTVSLVAVLIPLLFMGSVLGRMFREFAVTLAVAIGVSAVLSLTLTPMMCAHLLKAERPADERGWFTRLSEKGYGRMLSAYERGLGWVLDHQRLTQAVTLATVLLTATLAWVIPTGFFPQEDTGLLVAMTEGPPDASFEWMSRLQQRAVELILEDPDVENVASAIGADGTNPTTNSGRMAIALKPRAERKVSADALVRRLQDRLSRLGGFSVFLQSVQDLQIDNRVSRTQFQYSLEDADRAELDLWAQKVLERMKGLPELRDVANDAQAQAPATVLAIDRDTASRVGVPVQVVDDTLYDAFGQRQVSNIFTQLNLYRVVLEVKPALAADPEVLSRLYVRAQNGAPVPLSALVRSSTTVAPLTIGHQGQFPSATLSFNVAPGVALGTAVNAIERTVAELEPPRGLHAEFQGAARAFGESLATEPLLILAALIAVYIVLGVLYESFVHPITILSTLPSAGVGALLALLVFGTELSVIAIIGLVLLIGIVKKNAIMMIDFALSAEREQHLSPRDAIFQACLLRFRPIMMTTMAALLGGLPLALATGTGSELRRPLGLTIVGGLLLSQVVTLFTTPVMYLALDRLKQRVEHWRHRAAPVPGPAA